jgi:hypothetical protein
MTLFLSSHLLSIFTVVVYFLIYSIYLVSANILFREKNFHQCYMLSEGRDGLYKLQESHKFYLGKLVLKFTMMHLFCC